MVRRIKNGNGNLNFSEFGMYSIRKGVNKLRAIATTIKEGSMHVASYTLIDSDIRLGKEAKDLITNWALKTRDNLLSKN